MLELCQIPNWPSWIMLWQWRLTCISSVSNDLRIPPSRNSARGLQAARPLCVRPHAAYYLAAGCGPGAGLAGIFLAASRLRHAGVGRAVASRRAVGFLAAAGSASDHRRAFVEQRAFSFERHR